MNPFVSALLGGELFAAGLAVATSAVVLRHRSNGMLWNCLLAMAWGAGTGIVALSSVPLLPGTCLLWMIGGAALMIACRQPVLSAWRRRAAILFVLFSAALGLAELRYQLPPAIPVAAGHPIYVIGDSLSAGIRTGVRLWPDALEDQVHLHAVNLAKPGATLGSALRQVPGIADPASLVFVEIGGNDLIGEADADAFRAQLDALLQAIVARNPRVAMFELPLPPFRAAFGAAQRETAQKYGVQLIPRRILARLLGTEGFTVDGLHLSQKGHAALAATLAGFLRIERPPSL
jgi:lysophospholipase L1-like esterase